MKDDLTPCPYLHCYDKIRVFIATGEPYDSCAKCRYKHGTEGTKYSPAHEIYKEGEAYSSSLLRLCLSRIQEGIKWKTK